MPDPSPPERGSSPELDSPHFHDLHHLLWECHMLMVPIGDQLFADSELSLPLAGTLDLIATWPGATVTDLSRHYPKTQQAISQLVAKLEKLGYIERRVGPGRGVGLYLTTAGAAAQADGNRREELIEARLAELLGSDTYIELRALLEQARAGLSKQPPEGADHD